jgi:hypothetical protein
MTIEQLRHQWYSFQPIRGVAFFVNDAVQVRNGANAGSRGAVISLEAVEPEPLYLVELASGSDVTLPQSALDSIAPRHVEEAIATLQTWYARQCDGDWEHRLGVTITTLDNPGWSIRVPLEGTSLADARFDHVDQTAHKRGWIICRKKDGWFEGSGGPNMLGELLTTFSRWARQNGAA